MKFLVFLRNDEEDEDEYFHVINKILIGKFSATQMSTLSKAQTQNRYLLSSVCTSWPKQSMLTSKGT